MPNKKSIGRRQFGAPPSDRFEPDMNVWHEIAETPIPEHRHTIVVAYQNEVVGWREFRLWWFERIPRFVTHWRDPAPDFPSAPEVMID